jgi:hypothetical protein
MNNAQIISELETMKDALQELVADKDALQELVADKDALQEIERYECADVNSANRIHKILSGRRTGKNSIIRNALLELQSEGVKIILVSYPCSKKIIPEKNAIYVHVPKSEYADENFKDIWFTHPKYSDEPIETKDE